MKITNEMINEYSKIYKEYNNEEGLKEVEKILKISNGNISECCRGKRKTAGGFVWRYEDERKLA